MRIHDTCPCGAKFEVEDKNESYAPHQHRDWLAAHAVCRVPATTYPEPLYSPPSADAVTGKDDRPAWTSPDVNTEISAGSTETKEGD